MLGAITGDIVGSIYEHANIKTKAARSYLTDDLVEVVDRFVEYVGT